MVGIPRMLMDFKSMKHISKLCRLLLPRPFKFSENLGIFLVFVSVFSDIFCKSCWFVSYLCLLLRAPA